MLTVTITEPDAAPRQLRLDGDEATIGRVAGNDIVLPSNGVSKRHARIVVRYDDVVVIDLKSTNGTFVDGQRINGTHPIRLGQEVGTGEFTIRLDAAKPSAAPVPQSMDDGIQSLAPAPPRATLTPASAEPVIAFVDDPPSSPAPRATVAPAAPQAAPAPERPALPRSQTSGAPPVPPRARQHTSGAPAVADPQHLVWLADLMAAGPWIELRVRPGGVSAAVAGADVPIEAPSDLGRRLSDSIRCLQAFAAAPGPHGGAWSAPDNTHFAFVTGARPEDALLVVRSPESAVIDLRRLLAEGALPGVAAAWLETAVAAGAGVLVASADLRDASTVARALASGRNDAFAVATGVADDRFAHVDDPARVAALGADVVLMDPLPPSDVSWASGDGHRAPTLVATLAARSVATAVAAVTSRIASQLHVDAATARSMFGARFDLVIVVRRTRKGTLFVQHMADVETNGVDEITVRPILLGRARSDGSATEYFTLGPAPALAELAHDAASAGISLDPRVSADALLETSDGWTAAAE